MKNINNVCISGNLTRDAELRATQGGTAVLGFTVACNDSRKNPQTGEWEDVPNFVDCAMFGRRAEGIARYLAKGTHVFCRGKLRQSKWQDKDGKTRSKIEILIDDVEFFSRQNAGEPTSTDQGLYDDDMPF